MRTGMRSSIGLVATLGVCAWWLTAGVAAAQTFTVGATVELDFAPPPPRELAAEVRYGYDSFDTYDGYSYEGNVWVQGRWEWDGRDWRWIPGYWTESRPGFVWFDGYWSQTPHRTYRWVPGRWEPVRRGYHFRPGHWENAAGHWHWHQASWIAARDGYDWEPGRWLGTGAGLHYLAGRWRATQRRRSHRHDSHRVHAAPPRRIDHDHRVDHDRTFRSGHFAHDNFRSGLRSEPRPSHHPSRPAERHHVEPRPTQRVHSASSWSAERPSHPHSREPSVAGPRRSPVEVEHRGPHGHHDPRMGGRRGRGPEREARGRVRPHHGEGHHGHPQHSVREHH